VPSRERNSHRRKRRSSAPRRPASGASSRV